MKRRIKRRVFLMSMALASGASATALARETPLPHFDTGSFTGSGHAFGLASDEWLPRIDDSPAQGLFAGLKRMPERLHGRAETMKQAAGAKGWQVQMLQPESGFVHGLENRLNRGLRIGVALRASF